jgi:hypothetical protein
VGIDYDPIKNARNIQLRGLSFEDVALLDWETARIKQDSRRDYGERRMQAFLYGSGKPYVVVFTMRGETMWVISFRRARQREARNYGEQT